MVVKTPRTEDELAVLLRERPKYWEHRLYAATLLIGRDELSTMYHDHLIRYAEPSNAPLSNEDSLRQLESAFSDALARMAGLMRLMDADMHERAFGERGESGDPQLIQHLAKRTLASYKQLMEWETELRSARVPQKWQHAFQLAADMIRNAIQEVWAFIDHVVDTMDNLESLAAGASETEPMTVNLTLVLTVDEETSQALQAELDTLRGPYAR